MIETEMSGPMFRQASTNNMWRNVSFVLGLILAGGAVFSILGKAFYVTRPEFTEKVIKDETEKTSTQEGLKAVNKSLTSLEMAVRDLSITVSNLKGSK